RQGDGRGRHAPDDREARLHRLQRVVAPARGRRAVRVPDDNQEPRPRRRRGPLPAPAQPAGGNRVSHRAGRRLRSGRAARAQQQQGNVQPVFTLYFAPHTCSLASHIALKDAGASYNLKRIDFASTEQRSLAYLAINPKARVPAMVTPRGILTETPAMLAFIAQSFPAARLAPLDDPFAFAELQAFNSY